MGNITKELSSSCLQKMTGFTYILLSTIRSHVLKCPYSEILCARNAKNNLHSAKMEPIFFRSWPRDRQRMITLCIKFSTMAMAIVRKWRGHTTTTTKRKLRFTDVAFENTQCHSMLYTLSPNAKDTRIVSGCQRDGEDRSDYKLSGYMLKLKAQNSPHRIILFPPKNGAIQIHFCTEFVAIVCEMHKMGEEKRQRVNGDCVPIFHLVL